MSLAAVFALLDDNGAAAAGPTASRLYTDYAHQHVCAEPAQLDAVCAAIDADLHVGLQAVVLADYEWGVRLAGLPLRGAFASMDVATAAGSADGVLRCLMFRQMRRLDPTQVDAWLAQQEAADAGTVPVPSISQSDPGAVAPPGIAGVLDLHPSIDRAAYDDGIAAIHAALQAGEAYQINYTLRLAFAAYGTPIGLYRRLRMRQPVSFGALIALPDARWVLSCSPELFLAHQAVPAHVVARPMKGTAARRHDTAADQAQAAALAQDPKNRAENLMIVDLLRNDIGRIARTGSVRVPALFSVEGHPTLWQMTSTVEATPRPGTRFGEILRALFPCGSITGAPKHRAMQLIDTLETTPRGLYTGAIGWLDAAPAVPPGATVPGCGDFCLSVAIRTLVLEPPGRDGLRAGTLGVGGGIVLDSRAADEYQECLLKARFLTELDPGFRLFETLYADGAGTVRHLALHLARLQHSATRLGFVCDAQRLRASLDRALQQHLSSSPAGSVGVRVRLALARNGDTEVVCAALTPLPDGPVRVVLASDLGLPATNANDPLLQFKTTRRADYDAGWQQAERQGAFDALFFNRDGELTEGGRSNVFVKLDGRWWTPPLSCGVLPGVMRGQILADPAWAAAERRLTLADVRRAEDWMVCNALRGALPAQWVPCPD